MDPVGTGEPQNALAHLGMSELWQVGVPAPTAQSKPLTRVVSAHELQITFENQLQVRGPG